MIEFHGRLARRRRHPLHPPARPATTSSGARSRWRRRASSCCARSRTRHALPISAGERLYTLADFSRLAVAARLRRGADGHRPLRRARWRPRRSPRWPRRRTSRLAALLDRAGRVRRGAALRLVDAEHAAARRLRRVRRGLAQRPGRRLESAEPGRLRAARRPGPRPRPRRGGDRRAPLQGARLPLACGTRHGRRNSPARRR